MMSKELVSYKKLKVNFAKGARLLNNELYGIDANSLVFLQNMATLSGSLQFLDKRAEHIFKFRNQIFLINKSFAVKLTGTGEYSYDSLIEIKMSMPKECNETIFKVDDSNSDGVLFYTRGSKINKHQSICCYFLDRNFEVSQFTNNFTLIDTAYYKDGLSFILTDEGRILLGKSIPTITNSINVNYREVYHDKAIRAIYVIKDKEVLVAITGDSLIKYKIVNIGKDHRFDLSGNGRSYTETFKISLIQLFMLKCNNPGEMCNYLGNFLFSVNETQIVDISQDVPLVKFTLSEENKAKTFIRISDSYILTDKQIIKFLSSAEFSNVGISKNIRGINDSCVTNSSLLSSVNIIAGIEEIFTRNSDELTISDALSRLDKGNIKLTDDSLDANTKISLAKLLIKAERFSQLKKEFRNNVFNKLLSEQEKLKNMHKCIVKEIEKFKAFEEFIKNEINSLYKKALELKVDRKEEFFNQKEKLNDLLEKATKSLKNRSSLLAKLKLQRSVLREML